MKYNDLKNSANPMLLKDIDITLKIFYEFKDSKIIYYNQEYYDSPVKVVEYDLEMKKILSLFLAALKNNENVKKIFLNVGISYERMMYSIERLNLKHFIINENRNVEYPDEYDDYMGDLINKLKTSQSIKNINTEELIHNSTIDSISGSNIIQGIFQALGILDYKDSFKKCMKELDYYIVKKNELKEPFSFEKNNIRERADLFRKIDDEENILEKYSTQVNIKNSSYNPAIGRENEIKKLMICLLSDEISPVLVGEAGVGKTAVVEGLIYKIKKGLVPDKLKNLEIINLKSSNIVAGCSYVGMLEKKVEELIKEVKEKENAVLFIDEIHTVIGCGSGNNSTQDLANILKPYIDREEIKIIGATTNDEYNEFIASDKAFKRRFEKIIVKELNDDILEEIAFEIIPKLEEATSVKFNINIDYKKEIINEIINATSKEKRDQSDFVYNPDLMLKIIKKSFAYAQIENKEELDVSHIAQAISNEDRLYESSRKKSADNLIKKYKELNINTPINNIIMFPKNKNL